ncbi:MAG TPA: phosphatidylglycerophosphatase A [Chromatiales bacterium]|nr:phosphatidylglycerophosphatase A [Chromatiales bacterium]
MADKSPDWRNPLHLLAFWFGAGAAPKAPGTVGTLAAVPLYLLLQPLSPGLYLSLVAGLFLLGIWICGATARALEVHDHPGIVFDEVVGYLVTMIHAPRGWGWVAAGFALFRLFDILKPWPIGPVDRRVEGGLGIMLDDVIAGFLALICLQAAALVL